MKIYNALSRKKEEFVPLSPGEVKMYVCGITPYDECHIGHARCYVVFDVIRRYLEYRGFKVQYVQNFTDIDDKIINKAKESLQSGKLISQHAAAGFSSDPPISSGGSLRDQAKEIAEKYIVDYFKQMDLLNVKRADEYPRVTEHTKEIIEVVKSLVDKGYAYEIEEELGKSVYFEVAKFKDYGKLSRRAVEEMMPGARVEVDERKKSPLDFALWKSAKEDEPSWDSPWGKGRPGWHIECSVMSMDHLGTPTLDIHGGGQDLIFPHHENEIAQSEAYTGKPFAKYWIHNAFVTVNKEKMSKSLGNFFTIREVLEKYDPMVVRLFLLSAHYRQPMDFSDKELDAAKESWQRLANFRTNLKDLLEKVPDVSMFEITRDTGATDRLIEKVDILEDKIIDAMDDDFNVPKALGYLYEMVTLTNKFIEDIFNRKIGRPELGRTNLALKRISSLYGRFTQEVFAIIDIIPTFSSHKTYDESQIWNKIIGRGIQENGEIKKLIERREDARKNKDWATADRIRNELKDRGIIIEDTPFGPRPILKIER